MGGQTSIDIRDEHLQYIFTWYARLSCQLVGNTYAAPKCFMCLKHPILCGLPQLLWLSFILTHLVSIVLFAGTRYLFSRRCIAIISSRSAGDELFEGAVRLCS